MHGAMSQDNSYLRFFSMSRTAARQEAERICRPLTVPPCWRGWTGNLVRTTQRRAEQGPLSSRAHGQDNAAACTVMASLPQRLSGITSVGLKAVALVKPR
jgi:hypothetical protein